MSASHNVELHPDEKITIQKWGNKVVIGAAAIGAIFLGLTAFLGTLDSSFAQVNDEHLVSRAHYSYVVAYTYFLSISLGALFFVLLQHVVRAKWSVTVRRLAEILTQTFPMMLFLALPIIIPLLMGKDGAYGAWVTPSADNEHLIHMKHAWLNPGFFSARLVFYCLVWIVMSRYFFKQSVDQDESGDPAVNDKLRKVAAPMLIVYAITLCAAAFDILMSISPAWFSPIFGVYYFAGAAISIFAVLSLVSMVLQKKGRLKHSISVEHYHDLGKLLFAFVFFWSYIAFSQFMLIWYANMPEETFWFRHRMFTSWRDVSLLLLFGHCVFPFLCLLSRWTKRILGLLAFFSVWMMVMHYVDLFWVVMPEFTPTGFTFGLTDITALLGVGGMFVASAAFTARKVKLIPVRDPGLAHSLGFENY
jgi:hypothetical protein